MSSRVFPSALPGLEMAIKRTPLPPPVKIRTTPSQREFRARDATLPRYRYSVGFEFLRAGAEAELQALTGFFLAHGGSFESFLLSDPVDRTATLQAFGVGNGSASAFPLTRSLGGFVEAVDALATTPEIRVAGTVANLLANGGFETDTNADGLADGWTLVTIGSTGAISKGLGAGPLYPGPSGPYQFVEAAALNGSIGINQVQPVLPGTTLTLSVDQTASPGVTVVVTINWLTASGGYISESTNAAASAAGRRSVSGVAPAGAALAACYVLIQSASGGTCLLNLDEAQLNAGTNTSFSAARASASPATGLVTFDAAPGSGAALTWSGEFYRRVRFARDEIEFERFLQDLWNAKKVELVSTRD